MTELPEQDIYGLQHDADSPSEEWVAGYIAATAAAEQRLRAELAEKVRALRPRPNLQGSPVNAYCMARDAVLAILDTPPEKTT